MERGALARGEEPEGGAAMRVPLPHGIVVPFLCERTDVCGHTFIYGREVPKTVTATTG